jgi:hypothetical protein
MRRYYKIIAYTSYIGEELIKYHVREDNETNEEFDALLEQTLDECVDMWIGDHDYWTEYGFNTFEEFRESFRGESLVRAIEIDVVEFVDKACGPAPIE